MPVITKTVDSYTATYCPVDEFLNRVDIRAVQQLAADDNNPIAAGSLVSNAKVLAALRSASGYLEAAALMGGRYLKDDLAALLATDTNARAMLYDIVANFAVTRMRERRPAVNVQKSVAEERAESWLEELAQGTRIFGFTEVQDAGVMDHQVETTAQVETRRLSTFTAMRLFGTRNNRQPV